MGSADRSELMALLRLSLPLAAGMAGNQLMSVVDTAMVGRLGAQALGGVGIGNGIYFAFTVFGLGLVLGMDPLVAQALGAGEEATARRVYWQGVRIAVGVGIPLTVVITAAPLGLEWAGVEAGTAREVRRFLVGRLPNTIPFLVFGAARSYLQAKGVTRPIVVAMIAANVVNLVGNALLVYGDGALLRLGLPPAGLPALGVMGSGLATGLASVVSMIVLARAVSRVPAPEDPHRRSADRARILAIARLGLPVGLQYTAEVGVFALASVLAGTMSALAVAGHQIAITLASMTFTASLGVASAAGVRVGLHVGRGDTPAARRTGILALQTAGALMCCFALLFLAAPAALARSLTDDPQVIASAVPLVMIAAVFQISDGAQAVGSFLLRGAGDTRAAMVANVLGHYAVGLPLAVALGFGAQMGAPGLWWGLCAGLTAVAVALTWRFLRISAREIERV